MKGRVFSFSCLLALLSSCVIKEQKIEKPQLSPFPPTARAFLDTPAVLIANVVTLRLHPDLYGEVKYRVDRNFHDFKETRDSEKRLLLLKNFSGLIDQPVKFWAGAVEIAAMDGIQAEFRKEENGILLEAHGDVFWKQGDQVIRADSLRCVQGVLEFTGRK